MKAAVTVGNLMHPMPCHIRVPLLGTNEYSMIERFRTWMVRCYLARLKTPRDVARVAFRKYAARMAVVDEQRSVTYAELGQRTYRIAAAWRSLGVKSGDVVAVCLSDSVCQVEARLAAAECGSVLCLLAPWSSTEQLALSLGLVEPKLFIHDGSDAALNLELNRRFPTLIQLRLQDGEPAWLTPGPAAPCAGEIDPLETLSLGFTSGTTGTPKLMSATYGVYLTSIRLMVDNVGVGRSSATPDVMLVGIPLTGAGSGVLLPTLLSGGCLVVPTRYDAPSLIEAIARYRVTRVFTTPSLLIDMLDHPRLDEMDTSSLRNIIYGTEMMPAAKLEEALRRFGPILQQGYGSAEVLPPVSMLQPREHMPDGQPAPRSVLMSCGRVVPQVSVRIVDEDGRDLPAGTPGEVLVKSPTLFRGYGKRPDLSSDNFRDGFLRIGDMGVLTTDGYLTMLGRKPDVLQRDGQTIFPRYVEEALHDHPSIKEASYVQGPQGTVMAFSLRWAHRRPQAQGYWSAELAQHLQTRVPSWQAPDHYHLFDELPRSPLGKVLRREVRARLVTHDATMVS